MSSSLELHRALDLLRTQAIASLSTQLSSVSVILTNNPLLDGKGKTNHADLVGIFSRIHELVEVLSSQDQAVFGSEFVPWAIQFIPNIPIKFMESAWEQQLRHGLLQIVKQIASSPEAMRPFLEDMMNLLIKILREDNEENAMLSLHIMIDLHKIHRTVLEPFAQAMVDFVLEAFEAFPETCETIFEAAKRDGSALQPKRRATIVEGLGQPGSLLKGSCSFKVLIECPVMIVLLFQIHRKLISENIAKFVPQVIRTLGVAIERPPLVLNNSIGLEQVLAAENSRPLQSAYSDYISAQVKTLSFLAYILRGFASMLRPYHNFIPPFIIRVLRDCPAESAAARKELLVAIRHILSTELRQAFIPFIEQLLDEGLLLGEGYTSYYVLRPLALSMLADLIHHVRVEIKLPTVLKIIWTYSGVLHDATLPIGVQTMSAKLLVNLIDSMLMEDFGSYAERRSCLMRILMAFIEKFDWLSGTIKDLLALPADKDPKSYDLYFDDPLNARPIKADVIAIDPNRDNYRDFKFMLKTIIGGLKNVIFALKANTQNFSPPSLDPNVTASTEPLFSVSEVKDFVRLFKSGVLAFDIFNSKISILSDSAAAQGSSLNQQAVTPPDSAFSTSSIPPEEKELYDQFTYVFTLLDPSLFQEVFSCHMDFLVKRMATNHALLVIPQYLLAISGISRNYAGLLIRYLMDNFDQLVSEDQITGAVFLRLFKLVFLAVSVYPDENEATLQPYLAEIIMNCLKNHHKTHRSLNYFLLLRSLFRSIGGGRFDALYKEVLPLLPIILEELGKLPTATTDPNLRELYVELCLTTPVRLSVLLPYLSHLMKPLVLALQSSPDLISQGLRTLELCIDNLTQDFLEPIVFPVLHELLTCLWNLLKPHPANQAHSHAAMRILGKMGGRSHRYLPPPTGLNKDASSGSHSVSLVVFIDSCTSKKELTLPLDQLLLSASKVLHPNSKQSASSITKAYQLIQCAIKQYFFVSSAHEEKDNIQIPFKSILENDPNNSTNVSEECGGRLVKLQHPEQSNDSTKKLPKAFCHTILRSLFWAAQNPLVKDDATRFILDMYSYALLGIVKPEYASPFAPSMDFFLDVLVDVASGLVPDDPGKNLFVSIIKIVHDMNQTFSPVDNLIMSLMMEKLVGACYRADPKEKMGICRWISELCHLEVNLSWIWTYEVRLARGLLYIMKSLSPGLGLLHGLEIKETLLKLLKLCNRQVHNGSADEKTKQSQSLNQLIALLVAEISNANGFVRDAVQSCLQLLSDVTASEVTELLLPLKDRLLAPIFTKPLRALPVNLQIGYIDAITYCLSLRPPLLDVNDELLRLINEAIALSEADDTSLATKTNQIQNNANILQLRLICIRLLSMASSTAEFQTPKLQPLRNLIVAVFFKSLYSRSPEVVEASRDALAQVMVHQNKLPKDLLQTALRPVLTNLAEAKRLTLPGLEGLRRVLELLTSYFKAEIGKKLLDHLASWSEPKKPLQEASGRPLCEYLEIKVISSILDIFHLLPPSGHVFVAELIFAVINLEKLILRSSSSPFRPPLHRLLVHYPVESSEFFVSHLDDPLVVELFAHIIQMDGSDAICDVLCTMLPPIKSKWASMTSSSSVSIDLVHIFRVLLLSKRLDEKDEDELFKFIWNRFFSRERPEYPEIEDSKEAMLIFSLAKSFLNVRKGDFEIIFMLISATQSHFVLDFTNLPFILRKFLRTLLNPEDMQLSISNAKLILELWIKHHDDRNIGIVCKSQYIRLILLPFLTMIKSFGIATAVLDSHLVKSLIKTFGSSDIKNFLRQQPVHASNVLVLEEIQALSALLSIMPSTEQFYDFIIVRAQFGDPSLKFSAYSALLKHIQDDNDSNSEERKKSLLLLLPYILKMPTSETKPIVKQALDLLLTSFLAENNSFEEIREVIVSTLTKDGHISSLIAVIWSSLASHADSINVVSKDLLEEFLQSFFRSAQAIFILPDSRALPFEFLSLIVKMKRSVMLDVEDLVSQNITENVLSLSLKLLTAFNPVENASFSDNLTFENAVQTLGDFLEAFRVSKAPIGLINYAPLEKLLLSESNENLKYAFRVLLIMHERRSNEEVVHDINCLQDVLLSCLNGKCPRIFTELQIYLEKLLNFRHNSDLLNYRPIHNLLSKLVEFTSASIAAGQNLPIALYVVGIASDLFQMEKIIMSILRLLPKLCKDFYLRQEQSSSNASELELFIKQVLKPAFTLLVKHLGTFNEIDTGPFVAAIQSLWEKTVNSELMNFVIDLLKQWISSDQHLLNWKDISDILLTSSRLDQIKDDSLMINYLDLILLVYKSPELKGTELTSRLEGSFLQGLVVAEHRDSFVSLLDENISKRPSLRIQYILGAIRWSLCGSFNWMPCLIHLVLKTLKKSDTKSSFPTPNVLQLPEVAQRLASKPGFDNDMIVSFLSHCIYFDEYLTKVLWNALFAELWDCLSEKERNGVSKAITKLIATEDHYKQFGEFGPIFCILSAASKCNPSPVIPPHLLHYSAKNLKTWYCSMYLLEQMSAAPQERDEASAVLCSLYKDLAEDDIMFGVLKRQAGFNETGVALSFALVNKWPLCQKIVETGQNHARSGMLPFSEHEFKIMEDLWLESAEKLQQWDLVTEVSKLDGDTNLNLECVWRLGDWLQNETYGVANTLLKTLTTDMNRTNDVQGDLMKSRGKFFEAFLVLNQIRELGPDKLIGKFQTTLEEAIQSTLQLWTCMPSTVTRAHVGIFHQFQMFVEIQEAMTIYSGISNGQTNPASLLHRPQFLTDLKGLLSTWRERMPNRMDDLNAWSDLLAWRQHIFSALNVAFQPQSVIDPATGQPQQTQAQTHPFAYRGYHEMAWIINKFARVCRKNGLPEVCLSFLNRIYTLPNIEIQDAFSKLKEQTLCYMDNPSDLPTALEVINATNLNYFSGVQKGEFFALKAQILSRMGMIEEANRIFAQAVQIDLNIGIGWSLWGQFNDQRFQQTHDINLAVNAINCYLQASTLFKISKARKFGARILWLLTYEDAVGSMAKSFELYNNDLPTWFWVIFIPQLITSLTRKEVRHARFLLIKIAKSFPQALYLPLRTANDEFKIQFGSQKIVNSTKPVLSQSSSQDTSRPLSVQQPPNGEDRPEDTPSPSDPGSSSQGQQSEGLYQANPEPRKSPVEYAEDLLAILKTGYPLLALSMENMVEHIVQRLRSTADEDLYRVIVTLLSEAFQQIMVRFNSALNENSTGNGMEASLKRVSFMLGSSAYLSTSYKEAFDKDFGKENMELSDLISLLESWRIRLYAIVSKCPKTFSLESLSRFLAEFEHQRYDEVELPGQYLMLKDSNLDFIKIDRFEPSIDIVRRHGSSYRRLAIRGSNGSVHRFVVQNPSARQSRREEKIMQFFRIIKKSLKESPNTRRRGLDFTIPVIVALSAHVRLIQDDPESVSLEEVYEDFCENNALEPDDILIYYKDALYAEISRLSIQLRKGNVEVLNLRVDIFQQICQNFIKPDLLTKYVQSFASSPQEYWLFRQSFSRQYAASIFLSYVMALGHRYPHKISFSKSEATVVTSEILPSLNPNGQITLVEAVPFRLTPNLQDFMTPSVIEGVLSSAIHSIAEVYYKPESELCEFLPLIVRDELISWMLLSQTSRSRFVLDSESKPISFNHDMDILDQAGIDERQFLGRVVQNCELIMKRCQTLACVKESEKAIEVKSSALQTITDLISCATNPQKLSLMDCHWHPWL